MTAQPAPCAAVRGSSVPIYARVTFRYQSLLNFRNLDNCLGFRCVVRRPPSHDPVHCSSCTQR